MIKYITTEHGFAKENITVLMDDNKHTKPTKQAILDAFVNLVQSCEAGDIVFCHFAGTFVSTHKCTMFFQNSTFWSVHNLTFIVFVATLSICWYIGHGSKVKDISGDEGTYI